MTRKGISLPIKMRALILTSKEMGHMDSPDMEASKTAILKGATTTMLREVTTTVIKAAIATTEGTRKKQAGRTHPTGIRFFMSYSESSKKISSEIIKGRAPNSSIKIRRIGKTTRPIKTAIAMLNIKKTLGITQKM